MSTTEPRRVPLSSVLESLPRFEFDHAVDDPQAPAEVTIYDPLADDPTTHWLSVDVGSAVDLADVA